MSAGCLHLRTEPIARRAGVDYVRCLDCGQVFEAEDLETVNIYDDDNARERSVRPARR